MKKMPNIKKIVFKVLISLSKSFFRNLLIQFKVNFFTINNLEKQYKEKEGIKKF